MNSHTMSDTLGHLMEKNLLEVFGQRDSTRRKVAITGIYTADCTFFESEERIVGYDALNAKVERILQDAPGFVFRAAGPAQVNHDLGCLHWSFSCCHRYGHRGVRARENSGSLHLPRQACERLRILGAIKMNNVSNAEKQYDFIVVGAGAAGSVLAAELSASGVGEISFQPLESPSAP